MYQDETYLKHYGVKGMKWGVRHDKIRETGRKASHHVKNYASRKYDQSNRATYKRSKTMTDEQLRAANKRYQLEKQYRDNVKNDRRDSHLYTTSLLAKSGGIFVSAAIGASAGAGGAMLGKHIVQRTLASKMAKTLVRRL